MVDLVLGDLRRPAFQRSKADAEALVLITYLDLTEALGLSGSHQGKTAFLGFVRAGGLNDLRVEHQTGFAAVVKNDDPSADADHVGGKAHAGLSMGV